MISAGEEMDRLQSDLRALHDLLENDAWRHIVQPELEKAYKEHLEGVTLRGDHAKRDEHLEAYHLATRLRTFVEDEMEKRRERAAYLAEKLHDALGED
jgi:hypothetical protein